MGLLSTNEDRAKRAFFCTKGKSGGTEITRESHLAIQSKSLKTIQTLRPTKSTSKKIMRHKERSKGLRHRDR